MSEFEPLKLVESFAGVCKEVIFQPRVFFKNLPQEGTVRYPVSFLFICVFLSSLFLANFLKGDYRFFLLLLFANSISALMVSVLLHGLARKIFGGQASFASTFRIIAYSSVIDIAAWIPLIGTIASFYGLYLIFIGLQELHNLKPRQAGLAVIIITVLALGMGIMATYAGKDFLNIPELGVLFTDSN
jgi:hypothetical protein